MSGNTIAFLRDTAAIQSLPEWLRNELEQAADLIENLTARAEAAEADARRYRWLRAQHDFPGRPSVHVRYESNDPIPLGLDDAIDAELAKEAK